MDIRLKVSREEKTLAQFLVKHRKQLRKSDNGPESLKPFTDFIIDVSVRLPWSAGCHTGCDSPGRRASVCPSTSRIIIAPPACHVSCQPIVCDGGFFLFSLFLVLL